MALGGGLADWKPPKLTTSWQGQAGSGPGCGLCQVSRATPTCVSCTALGWAYACRIWNCSAKRRLCTYAFSYRTLLVSSAVSRGSEAMDRCPACVSCDNSDAKRSSCLPSWRWRPPPGNHGIGMRSVGPHRGSGLRAYPGAWHGNQIMDAFRSRSSSSSSRRGRPPPGSRRTLRLPPGCTPPTPTQLRFFVARAGDQVTKWCVSLVGSLAWPYAWQRERFPFHATLGLESHKQTRRQLPRPELQLRRGSFRGEKKIRRR